VKEEEVMLLLIPRLGRKGLVAPLAVVVIALALIAPALAQTPTFSSVGAFGGDQLDLNVTFVETGLEPGATISYSIDALADLTATCSSSHHVTGTKVGLTDQPVSFTTTQQADANGMVDGSFTGYLPEVIIDPLPSCPGHLNAGPPESVTYKDITLTDTTNGIQTPIAGTVTSTD
jgi:hypothetical protein